MAGPKRTTPVYLEVGRKRVFAGAIDWPGWCRSGKTEQEAVEALVESAPRYAAVVSRTRRRFSPPTEASALEVVQRIAGDATTDFGAPGKVPRADRSPLTKSDLERLTAVLKASWSAFDAAARRASGRTLRTGPRGGGRDLDRIVQHVLDADGGYLGRIGGTYRTGHVQDRQADLRSLRREILRTLASAGTDPTPRTGPRGGVRWPPRYLVRRSAWHALDHAWEIEDRTGSA